MDLADGILSSSLMSLSSSFEVVDPASHQNEMLSNALETLDESFISISSVGTQMVGYLFMCLLLATDIVFPVRIISK